MRMSRKSVSAGTQISHSPLILLVQYVVHKLRDIVIELEGVDSRCSRSPTHVMLVFTHPPLTCTNSDIDKGQTMKVFLLKSVETKTDAREVTRERLAFV